MNHLEQLAAEYYEFSGYFIRTNVRLGRLPRGGYSHEIDVLAYHPQNDILYHIETSSEASSWNKLVEKFSKKYSLKDKDYSEVMGFEIKDVKKRAIVCWSNKPRIPDKWPDEIELISIPSFIQEICKLLSQRNMVGSAIPEGYPLLRAMKLGVQYGNLNG